MLSSPESASDALSAIKNSTRSFSTEKRANPLRNSPSKEKDFKTSDNSLHSKVSIPFFNRSQNIGNDIFSSMTPSKSRKARLKHDHFRVTVTYTDDDKSIKVFTDPERAEKFAARQKRSPFVKSAQVVKLN